MDEQAPAIRPPGRKHQPEHAGHAPHRLRHGDGRRLLQKSRRAARAFFDVYDAIAEMDGVKPVVLAVAALDPSTLAAAEALFDLRHADPAGLRLSASEPALVRGLVTSGGIGASAQLMAQLPSLEIVAVDGVGVDAVDLEHARSRGVIVTNTPGVLSADVADLAVGLLIGLARDILVNDRFVREGRWLAGPAPIARRRLSDMRLGVFGLGAIGMAIAERCRPMVASISYHNRRPRSDAPYTYVPSLRALARQVDALIVAAPGGPETDGVIDGEVLRALGRGLLVNVARGSLVDQAALIQALERGELGGAALDVFAEEPHVPDALRRSPQVILQPHMGSATVPTRQAMSELVLANLRAHFSGRPVLSPV